MPTVVLAFHDPLLCMICPFMVLASYCSMRRGHEEDTCRGHFWQTLSSFFRSIRSDAAAVWEISRRFCRFLSNTRMTLDERKSAHLEIPRQRPPPPVVYYHAFLSVPGLFIVRCCLMRMSLGMKAHGSAVAFSCPCFTGRSVWTRRPHRGGP